MRALFFTMVVVILTGPSASAKAVPKRIEIAVTQEGFEPNKIEVVRGKPVTLVFTRKTEKTCAKDIVIHLSEDNTVEKHLPLNQSVVVPVVFDKAGDQRYACSMNMIIGTVLVK